MINLRSIWNLFKGPPIDWPVLPLPDDSLHFFEALKIATEKDWSDSSANEKIYGFQVQEGSIWQQGLTNSELADFEKKIGMEFPIPLKNFYKVMNGLTLPGINLKGASGNTPAYMPVLYSYPEDLALMGQRMEWIYKANNIDPDTLLNNNISRIFPVYQHRFMLIDVPGNPILSMHGNDIIYRAENLSKCLANELMNNIRNVSDFESPPRQQPAITFWLD